MTWVWSWFMFLTREPWQTKAAEQEPPRLKSFPLDGARANHSAGLVSAEAPGVALPGRGRLVSSGLGWMCQMEKTDGWPQRKRGDRTDGDENNEREAEKLVFYPGSSVTNLLTAFVLFFLLFCLDAVEDEAEGGGGGGGMYFCHRSHMLLQWSYVQTHF